MSLNLIRKVFWPAAIALGFLVLLGATNGSVKTVSASDDDFCFISGPKVITVGKTYLYLGVMKEFDNHPTEVSLDNIIGNSKITSILDGDDFGDYQKINPSNSVHDLDTNDIFNLDDDLFPFFKDNFVTSILPIYPGCGDIRATLLEMIAEAIDRGNACNAFTTYTTSCVVNGVPPATIIAAQAAVITAQNTLNTAVAAQAAAQTAANIFPGFVAAGNCLANGAIGPTPGAQTAATCIAAFNNNPGLQAALNTATVATNNATLALAAANSVLNGLLTAGDTGSEQLYNDFDIDCPTQSTCAIAGNIITAVVDSIIKDINAGENDCDDIAANAEDAAILAGAAEIIAAQFNDYIDDVCELRFADQFVNSVVVVDVTCNSAGNFDITFSDEKDEEDSISMNVICRGPASSRSTITASQSSIEIVPAPGNVSHSLITVLLLDANGDQAGEGAEVDFTVNRCSIEAGGVLTTATYSAANTVFGNLNINVPSSATDIENSASALAAVDSTRNADTSISFLGNTAGDRTVAAAILGCNPADASPIAQPGVATITAIISVTGGQDIVKTVDVTVVGPPFQMTIAASPTSVRCGEKSTITATVKDAIGQNVSEHTRIEAVTNAGGVLGGTGAVANNSGPVVPISSTVGETFSGVATFYLLTSEQHTGPYEVVVSTGGSGALGTALGGVFSTPPVVIQVTVSCSLPAAPVIAAPAAPAPTITAPRTGTGPVITPPNTGDAGLAADSSSLALFIIVGFTAFVVGGALTVKLARR